MPTWTVTQHLHQNPRLEATQREDTCANKILSETPGRRLKQQAPCKRKRRTSTSWWPDATEGLSSEKKFHLQPKTDWEKNIRKFNALVQNSKLQSEEEHEFCGSVLESICARFGEYPANLQDFPLNFAIWSQFTFDCVWASSWLTKDHEDPSTTTSEITDRTHRRKQYARLEHISLVKNYDSEWSSSENGRDDRSRVLRLYIVCWSLESRSIQLLGTKLKDARNEQGFVEKNNLAAREVQFVWHVSPGASALDIKKNIQKDLNGQNPQNPLWWEDHVHVCVKRHWMDDKNKKYRNLMAQCQRSGSICDPIEARPMVLPVARVAIFVMERKFQRTSKETRYCLSHCRRLTYSSVMLPIFPATERLSLGHLRKRRRNYHFQGALENKQNVKTTLASNLLCIWDRILPVVRDWKSGTNTKKSGRRWANRCRTRAVDNDNAKTATSSKRLDATTHRESRYTDSQSFRASSICTDNGKTDNSTLSMNLLTMKTVPLRCAENTQSHGTLKIWDHKQFLSIMSRSDQWLALKYSKLQELWW